MGIIHTEPIRTTIAVEDSIWRVSRDVAAVMLADGKWYDVEDPTMPEGADGYLSFLQRIGEKTVMVNVQMADVKAVSYFGRPTSYHG